MVKQNEYKEKIQNLVRVIKEMACEINEKTFADIFTATTNKIFSNQNKEIHQGEKLVGQIDGEPIEIIQSLISELENQRGGAEYIEAKNFFLSRKFYRFIFIFVGTLVVLGCIANSSIDKSGFLCRKLYPEIIHNQYEHPIASILQPANVKCQTLEASVEQNQKNFEQMFLITWVCWFLYYLGFEVGWFFYEKKVKKLKSKFPDFISLFFVAICSYLIFGFIMT